MIGPIYVAFCLIVQICVVIFVSKLFHAKLFHVIICPQLCFSAERQPCVLPFRCEVAARLVFSFFALVRYIGSWLYGGHAHVANCRFFALAGSTLRQPYIIMIPRFGTPICAPRLKYQNSPIRPSRPQVLDTCRPQRATPCKRLFLASLTISSTSILPSLRTTKYDASVLSILWIAVPTRLQTILSICTPILPHRPWISLGYPSLQTDCHLALARQRRLSTLHRLCPHTMTASHPRPSVHAITSSSHLSVRMPTATPHISHRITS